MSYGFPQERLLSVLLFLVILGSVNLEDVPVIRKDLIVSLSTAKFDAFELTLRISLINRQWSLSTAFFSCRLPRKSLDTNVIMKNVLLPTTQLFVQIRRIILSNSLSNTLRFPDANLLVLQRRVYIALLALLQSSWMFTLKFPLFVIIVPRYGYSLQISRGSILKLKRCIWAEDCLFSTTMTFVFLLFTVTFHFWQCACRLSKQLCWPVVVSDIRIKSSA